MKAVLISIQPKWCELIASGKKTIEVRKTRPKIKTPFRCYIYETKARSDMPTFVDEDGHVLYTGRGQVIGEFVCDYITDIKPFGFDDIAGFEKQTCLTSADIVKYLNGFYGYGWHISDLKIYDKPRELSEFASFCMVDEKSCASCEHYLFDSDDVNGYRRWCGVYRRKPLTHPPQSWMYVEELQE